MSKTKILYDKTRVEGANWEENWRITEGKKYITCVRRINWHGDYDMLCNVYYRILKKNFTTPEQMLLDIWKGRIPLFKKGKPIK